MSFNLAMILHESALATPAAPVLKFGGTAVSYGDLDEQSARFAAGLREAGLEPGDVVAIHLPNLLVCGVAERHPVTRRRPSR